jgi:phosphodiesterase/alkaline phosphatase D-like protein
MLTLLPIASRISNNGYRDGSSGLNNTEQSFEADGGVSVDQRKMNAVRAYFEWMPIRQGECFHGFKHGTMLLT